MDLPTSRPRHPVKSVKVKTLGLHPNHGWVGGKSLPECRVRWLFSGQGLPNSRTWPSEVLVPLSSWPRRHDLGLKVWAASPEQWASATGREDPLDGAPAHGEGCHGLCVVTQRPASNLFSHSGYLTVLCGPARKHSQRWDGTLKAS